ncbi:DUF4907 domain-containing protein [Winogradskyella costae]|uniref:DUF4907 domain-containing protein n=1 Tax=Winogradskyella costae TaxID=2697008 RepID=UPI0015C89C54|nr:DUF4907 domain-containing protein [Winogradskyella costae]
MKNNYNSKAVLLGITILGVAFFYLLTRDVKKDALNETSFALQVKAQDSFWIYEVYNDNQLVIRQEFIPAIKGQQGFTSKADAEKIGNLVMRKLIENKMPAVSIKDLDANAIDFKKI